MVANCPNSLARAVLNVYSYVVVCIGVGSTQVIVDIDKEQSMYRERSLESFYIF